MFLKWNEFSRKIIIRMWQKCTSRKTIDWISLRYSISKIYIDLIWIALTARTIRLKLETRWHIIQRFQTIFEISSSVSFISSKMAITKDVLSQGSICLVFSSIVCHTTRRFWSIFNSWNLTTSSLHFFLSCNYLLL